MRFSRLFLAFWYLLASTNVPAFALDQLIPQTKTIASADFPCAHHDCGCKTAEQCRRHCCCHPKREQKPVSGPSCHLKQEKSAEPVTVRVSMLSAARCSGHVPEAGNFSFQKLAPHLPPAAVSAIRPLDASTLLPYPLAEPPSALAEAPEKIPIQLS